MQKAELNVFLLRVGVVLGSVTRFATAVVISCWMVRFAKCFFGGEGGGE